jgi:hypothetical protein
MPPHRLQLNVRGLFQEPLAFPHAVFNKFCTFLQPQPDVAEAPGRMRLPAR